MFHCNIKVALESWDAKLFNSRKEKIISRNKLVNRPFYHTSYIYPINLCTTSKKKKKRAKSTRFFPRETVLTSMSTLFSRRQSSRIHKDDCWKIVAWRTANIVHYSWIRKLKGQTKKKRDHFKIILFFVSIQSRTIDEQFLKRVANSDTKIRVIRSAIESSAFVAGKRRFNSAGMADKRLHGI